MFKETTANEETLTCVPVVLMLCGMEKGGQGISNISEEKTTCHLSRMQWSSDSEKTEQFMYSFLPHWYVGLSYVQLFCKSRYQY